MKLPLDLEIIINHFKGEKWFKEAVLKEAAEREERTRIANLMSTRAEEWSGQSPKDQLITKERIRKEIIKKGA